MRVFDVTMEDQPTRHNFDILTERKQNSAATKASVVNVTARVLELAFRRKIDNTEASAIVVLPLDQNDKTWRLRRRHLDPSDPESCQASIRSSSADDARGRAYHHSSRRHIFGHNGSCTDHSIIANTYTLKDNRSATYPHSISNPYWAGYGPPATDAVLVRVHYDDVP